MRDNDYVVSELKGALRQATLLDLQFVIAMASIALFGVTLVVAWPVEYLFFYSLFDYFDGAQDFRIATWLKATIAALAVIALHFALEQARRSWGGDNVDRRMGVGMYFLVIFFLVASGLMLAAIMADGGLLDLGGASKLSGDLGGLGVGIAQSTGQPWLVEWFKDYVLPVFPVVFTIALAIAFLITAYVAHCSLSGILLNGWRMIAFRREARLCRQTVKEFLMVDEKRREHARGDAQIAQESTVRDLADAMHVRANAAIGLIARMISYREANPANEAIGMSLGAFDGLPEYWWHLPLDDVRKRLDRLRELTSLDAIRTALGGQPKLESTT